MKKLILALLLVNAAIWSIPAHALLIDDTTYTGTDANVGVVDTLLGITNFLDNSSPITETEWVNSVLAPTSVNWTVTTNHDGTERPYYNVADANNDTGDIFAFNLNGDPFLADTDYFIIKNTNKWALFENLANVDWGVFNINAEVIGGNWAGDLTGFNLGNGEFTISHVTEFVGPASVPEPSISALLGIGLLGMIGVSRRRKVTDNNA